MAYDELHGLDSPMFYGGSNPAHVEMTPKITAPPVVVEGKQEKIYPIVTSGERPIDKAVPSGTPYFNQVKQMQNVSSVGGESGGPFGGAMTPENLGKRGETYQFHTDLPPMSEWDKPEYKGLIEREIANTNAFTNEPALMRQAAMDQVTSGNPSAMNASSTAAQNWLGANPTPTIPDVPVMPQGDYAKPDRKRK